MRSPHGGDRRVPDSGSGSSFGSGFDSGSAPLGAAFVAPDDRLARDVSCPESPEVSCLEPSEPSRWNA